MLDIETIKQTVSTSPLSSGGANFKTHYLKKTVDGYCFKPTIGVILFAAIFIIIGLAFILGFIYKLYMEGFMLSQLFFFFFGSIFSSCGIYFLFHFLKPLGFNKRLNLFYKGFQKSKERNTKNCFALNRIVALQIIGETIDSDDSSYKSFELNLVIDNATRLNCVDHGNLKSLIDDTKVLSSFLNVPIWYAESNKALHK